MGGGGATAPGDYRRPLTAVSQCTRTGVKVQLHFEALGIEFSRNDAVSGHGPAARSFAMNGRRRDCTGSSGDYPRRWCSVKPIFRS